MDYTDITSNMYTVELWQKNQGAVRDEILCMERGHLGSEVEQIPPVLQLSLAKILFPKAV